MLNDNREIVRGDFESVLPQGAVVVGFEPIDWIAHLHTNVSCQTLRARRLCSQKSIRTRLRTKMT